MSVTYFYFISVKQLSQNTNKGNINKMNTKIVTYFTSQTTAFSLMTCIDLCIQEH